MGWTEHARGRRLYLGSSSSSSGGMRCGVLLVGTLGSGAVGVVVGVLGTLGSGALGARGTVVGLGVTTLGGWCWLVLVERWVVSSVKISLKALIAFIWASPGASNGHSDWCPCRASARDFAAWVASSCADAYGWAQLWGKNSTVLTIRSLRVDGT